MSCCSPQHCSNSNSTGRERKVSQVVPKSYRCRASDPRRPNTPKRRHLQPCQLLLPCTCNSACSSSFAHQRGNKTLAKTNPSPPHLPSHTGFLKTRTKTIKKSIQHSANKCADKTHVGVWICETTSCFQPNKFNAWFPRGMHVGNWPTGVTADCKDPGEQTATLLSVCRMGILCSPFQFNQTSCKTSTTCTWHGCPKQTRPLARWPVLPSPSVLLHN